MSKPKTPVMDPKLAHLLDLIKENPHLPIVPMVNAEVVADDDYAWWIGAWGNAYLEKYYEGEERVYFYDEKDIEALITEVKGWDWYETATDDEALEAYRDLPWVKCIVVYITT